MKMKDAEKERETEREKERKREREGGKFGNLATGVDGERRKFWGD